MTKKPTYKELEKKISLLEKQAVEHRQIEEALPESEERFRPLFQTASSVILYLSPEHRIIEFNPEAERFYGLGREDVLGKDYLELFIPEEERDAVAAGFKKVLAGKPTRGFENRVVAHDGTEHVFIWDVNRLLDAKGDSRGVVAVGQDITERKRAEEELQKLASVVRHSADLVNLSTPEGKMIFLNEAGRKMLGIDPEDVEQKHILEVIPDHLRDLVQRELLPTLMAHHTWEGELQYRNLKTKKLTDVRATTFTIQDPTTAKTLYLANVSQDITERKKAERALQESEKRYRLLAENIDDVIWKSDLTLDWEYISPSTVRLTGFTSEEAMNLPIEEKLTPASLENVVHLRQEVLDDLKTNPKQDLSRQLEVEYHCKDGSTVWTEVNVKIEFDEEGNPKGFLGVTRDITDRKKAEEEKVKLESQLQQAQKMEAMGTLAGGVAHDLNNVLSGIVAYPDLLLMKLPGNSPLRKFILAMQDSAEKAAAIVQDLLTLARRSVATYERVNLNAVVCEYLESPEYMKMKSFYSNVEVKTNLKTDLPGILGSPVHLSKTVMNLISNAAEAITDKGKILIATENQYISNSTSDCENVEEGEYVALTVTDTGAGMTSEDRKRIFEPFYTKKKMGKSGTGIGMAVVWGTVRDHKGYIDVQSTIGKGTTFTLYFPMTRQKGSEDQVNLTVEDYMGAGESILVVDDLEAQRELAVAILSKLSYSVTAVSSGEEAVEYLKDHAVDLLLLDMIMDPGIDGFETYKRILETHPKQKAIITSGFSETDRAKETLRLGAGHYVMKPYTLEKIGTAVRDELGRD